MPYSVPLKQQGELAWAILNKLKELPSSNLQKDLSPTMQDICEFCFVAIAKDD